MTEVNGEMRFSQMPDPLFGEAIGFGQELPAPASMADEVITVGPDETDPHRVEIFVDKDEATAIAVQKLHGEVFVAEGIINSSELTAGRYIDEYSDRSAHIYIRNGTKVAGVRSIHAEKKTGLLSLPTPKHFEVDPEILRTTADVGSLVEIKYREVEEISGLVARKQAGARDNIAATTTLYARLLRSAMEQGTKLWIANVEPTYLRYLSRILGPDQAHQAGPAKEYMGPATIPVAINPLAAVKSVLEGGASNSVIRKQVYEIASEVFQGVDDRRIPPPLRQLLKQHGIATAEYSPVKRILKSPKAIAYAGIVAYSSARALPAAGVEGFDGSTSLLWGIDIATAVPYTWGMIETFTNEPRSKTRRAIGATVAAGSFAAPYAYFAAEGHNYPTYVNIAVGALIGAAIAKETLSTFFRRGKERMINNSLRSTDLGTSSKELLEQRVLNVNQSANTYVQPA